MFECYRNKKVLITGVTGFKGSWLYVWLNKIGADVSGFGLLPETEPSLYEELGMKYDDKILIGDIRDKNFVRNIISECKPEIIFHLAAQPIVNISYENPEDTFQTNINGLINLYEVIRNENFVKSLVVVTSDKCYRNTEGKKSFSEEDALGGVDPYSASKSCAEIISNSYALSLLKDNDIFISNVRAGNIIGGGDWSRYRLIPDIVKAIVQKKKLYIRYPDSVRPWQYVLDALRGYLMVGERMIKRDIDKVTSFNFGPSDNSLFTVMDIVNTFVSTFEIGADDILEIENPEYYESSYLQLNSTKANQILNWSPVVDTSYCIKLTSEWYKEYYSDSKAGNIILKYINEYINLLNQ